MLTKFLIITVVMFFCILLIAPAMIFAQDNPYCGLNVEGRTLYVWAFNSEGLNWQFILLKNGIQVTSETGTVINNAEKGGPYWLYQYALPEEGSYSAALQILNETDNVVCEDSLSFEKLKPECDLDIDIGLPGEDTIFNLFAKNCDNSGWGFAVAGKNGTEVYGTYGQVESDNWTNPITLTLPEGSYSVDFHIKGGYDIVCVCRVFKDFTVGIVEKNITELPEGKIVYISDQDGNNEIYIMNTDGTGQTRLTDNSANDFFPALSPDGTKIAFDSDRDRNGEIYIMNADGTGQARLTDNLALDYHPCFSPDGSKIVFSSQREGIDDIFMMNLDGTGLVNLTNDFESDCWQPYFSPDGKKIAFRSRRDGNFEIYIMNVDSTDQVNLTKNPADDEVARFSPDGKMIAFESRRDGNREIYIMNLDGSEQTNLTNNPAEDFWPSFSPDGSKITFQSDRDGNNEIYIMNVDGTEQIRITNNSANDREPCFFSAESIVANLPFRPTGPLVPKITTYIPTPLDISIEPSIIGANLLIATIVMLFFTVATGLFTRTLSENEEFFNHKIQKMRLVAYLGDLRKRIESTISTKMYRRSIAGNVFQLLGVILFYGLVFSLLDRTWNPFCLNGLVLFINMAIAYGIVGIADDIMQWRALKKWGVPAELSVRPTNLFISIFSILASRLLAIVPGIMFGSPEALRVDKSKLNRRKRNRLPLISITTFFVIGVGLWLLTIATSLIQRLSLSNTAANLVSGFEGFLLIVFAVTLQNTFVQILGFPGGFGQALRQKNRWSWFCALIAITFVFIHTLINPQGKLTKLLQNTGVILFLSVVGTYIIIAFGLWSYFKIKKRMR